jgi:iron complex transport system substrate-binding protein
MKPTRKLVCLGLAATLVAPATAFAQTPANPDTTRTVYPLTIVNCGMEMTFDAPPSRVYGMDQITTESLLSLISPSSFVGASNTSDLVPAPIRDAYAEVPLISQSYPSAEQLILTGPDFVAGNLEFLSFSQAAGFGGPLTRADLAAQGIRSFALTCAGEDGSDALMIERFLELGRIFDQSEKAAQLVAETTAVLDRIASRLAGVEPVRAFYYIDGVGPLQTLGQDLGIVGGVNIIAPGEGGCCPPAVATEEVVARNPQAILMTSFGGLTDDSPTLEQKWQTLSATIPTTDAVVAQRFVAVDFISFSTVLRLQTDTLAVAAFLHPTISFD